MILFVIFLLLFGRLYCVRLIIDVNNITRLIPNEIFGTNVEWPLGGNGICNDNGEPIPEIYNLIENLKPTIIRFPGGMLCDHYDWRDGIGPQNSRPTTLLSPDSSDTSKHSFGTEELIDLCSRVNGEAMIEINIISGNKTLASDWIGNEQYLDGLSPLWYANKFMNFSTAMLEIDSSIELIALGAAYDGFTEDISPEGWNEEILDICYQNVDYVSVHNAYYPMMFYSDEMGRVTTEELYKSTWASPELFIQSITELSEFLEPYEQLKGGTIDIALTEWNAWYCLAVGFPLSENCTKWMDQTKTMGSAIFFARMYQAFFELKKLKIVNLFKLAGHDFTASISSWNNQPKVLYNVVKLYQKHFGRILVDSQFVEDGSIDVFSSIEVGFTPAVSNVPELTSVASLSDDYSVLYINIVSRSWNTTYTINIEINNCSYNPNVIVRSISSEDVLDHSGLDTYDAFVVSPLLTEENAKNLTINVVNLTNFNGEIQILPFSIVTLEFQIYQSDDDTDDDTIIDDTSEDTNDDSDDSEDTYQDDTSDSEDTYQDDTSEDTNDDSDDSADTYQDDTSDVDWVFIGSLIGGIAGFSIFVIVCLLISLICFVLIITKIIKQKKKVSEEELELYEGKE